MANPLNICGWDNDEIIDKDGKIDHSCDMGYDGCDQSGHYLYASKKTGVTTVVCQSCAPKMPQGYGLIGPIKEVCTEG
jgi:hypothetical protein